MVKYEFFLRLQCKMCPSRCRNIGCQSPFQQCGLYALVRSKTPSLRSAAEVMSLWKHEHPGPHLSRSRSCPCSRKKHFLALAPQGSPAWYPVSRLAGHPVMATGAAAASRRCGPGGAVGEDHGPHSAWGGWATGQKLAEDMLGSSRPTTVPQPEEDPSAFLSLPSASLS